MPSYRHFSRIDTLELKSQIFKKLGQRKAENYFYNLERLLSLKLSKAAFEKLCYSTIGRENIPLHNLFIRAIIGNACGVGGQAPTGHSGNANLSGRHLGDMLPSSLRRGRKVTIRDHRIGDHPSNLGPYGKVVPAGNVREVSKSCTAPEVISVDSKLLLEAASVEDGEEVEQVRSSPSVQSRSPVTPPLGIPMGLGCLPRRTLHRSSASGLHLCWSKVPKTCQSSSELPDTRSLMKRMEHILELEGLGLSVDCANLLNSGMDEFMKRLIKPCMDLARSRCSNERILGRANRKFYHASNGELHEEHMQRSSQCYSASMRDFQVSMELNPQLLGVDWPVQLEKICLLSSEE